VFVFSQQLLNGAVPPFFQSSTTLPATEGVTIPEMFLVAGGGVGPLESEDEQPKRKATAAEKARNLRIFIKSS
jgi:hypothetical protein